MQRVCFKRFLSNGVRQVEEEIRKRLKQLVDKHGSELGYNPQRLEALLKDYCGEYKREINLLVIAAREGTARELLNTSGTKLGTWDLQRLVKRLSEDTGMSEDFARWAVESWALAFRNNPPGKQKQTSISGRPFEGEPQCVKSWAKEADRQDQLSLHEKATECYDRALEINPQDASAWSGKGFSLFRLGRYEEAIDCYSRALEINPRHASAWVGKGFSLSKLGRYEEAIECYNRALEINPQYASAWAGKGFNLSKLERHEEAIECYDKALEINPDLDWVWRSKAFSLTKLGRHNEAKYFFDQDMIKNQQRTDS